MKNEDQFIMDATIKYGSKGKKDAHDLVNEIGGLFAGGELNEEDKDKVFRTITEMYWKSKENNQKYTPKKYKTDNRSKELKEE